MKSAETEFSQETTPMIDLELRRNLIRVFCCVSVFLIPVLFNAAAPFYPDALAIVAAILLGVLAFRLPAAAFVIGVFFGLPGYIYQSGVPLWWIALILVVVAASAAGAQGNRSGVIGLSAAVLAGLLMLTPLYSFAVPLLLVTVLIRTRSSDVLTNVLLFLALIIPFQAIWLMSHIAAESGLDLNSLNSEEIYRMVNPSSFPLFHPLTYEAAPQVAALDLFKLGSIMASSLERNPVFYPYLLVFIDRLLILILPALIYAAETAVYVIVKLPSILFRRVIRPLWPTHYTPTIAMVMGALVFYLPLFSLQGAFNYFTGFNPAVAGDVLGVTGASAWFSVLGSSILVGGVVSLAGVQLRRWDTTVQLRSSITSLGVAMEKRIHSLTDIILNAKRLFPTLSVREEERSLSESGEQVAFALTTAGSLSLRSMGEKVQELQSVKTAFGDLERILMGKIRTALLEATAVFNNWVERASKLGVDAPNVRVVKERRELEAMNFEELFREQEMVNEHAIILVHRLSDASSTVVEDINREIDPQFTSANVEMGRRFAEQDEFTSAAEALLNGLENADEQYFDRISSVMSNLLDTAVRLRGVVEGYLTQILQYPKGGEGQEGYEQIIGDLDSIIKKLEEAVRLLSVRVAVEYSAKLVDTVTWLIQQIYERLKMLEEDNTARAPRGYDWGRDTLLIDEVLSLSKAKSRVEQGSLAGRLEVLSQTLQGLDRIAPTIERYALMNELLMNYPSIEQYIEGKLERHGEIYSSGVPVKPQYASIYVQLYAKNQSRVVYDKKLDVLRLK